jgi:polyphosphate kinase 2 (PPK2 family)
MLADSNVAILKFFLHISRDEQTRRLQARIDKPDKHWKLSDADIHERKYWAQYEDAYNRILSTTSHKYAPWFVIPADEKATRNAAISGIILELMKSFKLSYPKPTVDATSIKL